MYIWKKRKNKSISLKSQRDPPKNTKQLLICKVLAF